MTKEKGIRLPSFKALFRSKVSGEGAAPNSRLRGLEPLPASERELPSSLPGPPGGSPEIAPAARNSADTTLALPKLAPQPACQIELRETIPRPNRPPPIPMVVPPRLREETSRGRVAILLRSHVLDEKFDHLWNSLRVKGKNFDVFPLLDRSAIPIDSDWSEEKYPETIWHHPDQLFGLGLSQKSGVYNIFWIAGDLSMCVALVSKPQYDFYILIDYDVHFTGDAAAYIERLCDRLLSSSDEAVDGVGLDFRSRPVVQGVTADWPNWEHWEFFAAAAEVFPCVYNLYFPFVALSRRALIHVFASRQLEAARDTPPNKIVNCEAFVPSSLMAAGLKCVDLNTLMPGSYQSDSMGLQHLRSDRLAGLPLSFAIQNPPPGVEMIHAVYSQAAFLEKNYRQRSGSRVEIEWALAEVLQKFAPSLDPALLQSYLSRVQDRLSQLES